jgi:hypothetical protein
VSLGQPDDAMGDEATAEQHEHDLALLDRAPVPADQNRLVVTQGRVHAPAPPIHPHHPTRVCYVADELEQQRRMPNERRRRR